MLHVVYYYVFSLFGEMTEWLRGTPGKRVRLRGPAGSSPALSAILKVYKVCCARWGGSGAL